MNFNINIDTLMGKMQSLSVSPEKAHTHPRRDWYILLVAAVLFMIVINTVFVTVVMMMHGNPTDDAKVTTAYTFDRAKLTETANRYRQKDAEFSQVWSEGIVTTDPSK